MKRLERVSRPVVGEDLGRWIGRLAQKKLRGHLKPNRYFGVRLVTSGELKALPDLEQEDVDALQAWLTERMLQQPTIDDVPLISAHPRRPNMLVMDVAGNQLNEERQFALAGIGKVMWTKIPESRDPRLGLIVAQIINTDPSGYQQVASAANEAMYDAPATVTLGTPQMAISTDQGVVDL